MTQLSKPVREAVKQRAHGRCEYCCKPEAYASHRYHVDHIIAQKHRGSDELDNLAWACFECNTCKGTDVGSWDEDTGVLTPLFNPRTQVWDDHFEWNGAIITGKTAVGRVTVNILQLNQEDALEFRRKLMASDLWG